MEKTDRHHYQLESGRRIYAYAGVIGIDPKSLTVGLGYDDELAITLTEDEGELTPEEKRKIALFMIDAWKRFGDVE